MRIDFGYDESKVVIQMLREFFGANFTHFTQLFRQRGAEKSKNILQQNFQIFKFGIVYPQFLNE